MYMSALRTLDIEDLIRSVGLITTAFSFLWFIFTDVMVLLDCT